MKEWRFIHYLLSLALMGFLFLSIVRSQEKNLSENLRTWTNTRGESIEGILLAVEGDKVRLLVNGKEFVVPLSGLSDADNTFVDKWQSEVSAVQTQKLSVIRSQGEFQIIDQNGEVLSSIEGSELTDSGNPLPPDSVSEPNKAGADFRSQSQQIFPGQSIRTKTGASVDLYSATGAVVQVQGDSELQIPERSREKLENSLKLLKGSLFLNVDSRQIQSDRKEFRLQTPTAILTVKGTQFFATADAGKTISGVYEGSVEGVTKEERLEEIAAGFVAEFYVDRTEKREMSVEEREGRKVFDALTVSKSSLADRRWDWDAFEWEVHSLLAKDGPEGDREITNTNIQSGRNQAGNLFAKFRPINEELQYGEFRIDTVIREMGEAFLGAEFRVRANREVPLIVTMIGADRKESEKKKGGLLDRQGYEFLVQFHDLTTIQKHKIQNWGNYRREEDTVRLEKGKWTTHFVPFNRNDYPESYEVKSWYIFLCFGPGVVAEREVIEIEVAPPVLVFEKPLEE